MATNDDRPTDSRAFRIEHDSMGEVRVPADARWGAQTQRAVENFPISGGRIDRELIGALASIKGAAATVNGRLKVIPKDMADRHPRRRRRGGDGARGTTTSRSTSSRPGRARRRT